MDTIITANGLIGMIESGEGEHVLLSRCQLASLFEVYYGTITAHIKAVIRSETIRPSFKGTLAQVGKTVLPEYYDMEMVIALAFRLNSPTAERIRSYIVHKAMQPVLKFRQPISVFIPMSEKMLQN